MKTALPQQIIARLSSSDQPFTATFKNRLHGKLKQRVLFENFGDDWSASIDGRNMQFSVGKYSKNSVFLYSYVAGCKVSLTLPFYLLLHIE